MKAFWAKKGDLLVSKICMIDCLKNKDRLIDDAQVTYGCYIVGKFVEQFTAAGYLGVGNSCRNSVFRGRPTLVRAWRSAAHQNTFRPE